MESKSFHKKEMLTRIFRDGIITSDMYKNMKIFFEDSKDISKRLNKYVHKQGFSNFYVSRNHFLNQDKYDDIFISNFCYFLEKTIGIVAIMRLAIDPFPVLLMDKEIILRYSDSLIEPFREDFIDYYKLNSYILAYKQTDIYNTTYQSIVTTYIKKNESVYDVCAMLYINCEKFDEIFSQFNLLDDKSKYCALIMKNYEHITRINYDGFITYSSNRKSNNDYIGYSSGTFENFKKSNLKINIEYKKSLYFVINFK